MADKSLTDFLGAWSGQVNAMIENSSVSSSGEKLTPTLYVSEWYDNGARVVADIHYSGDGEITLTDRKNCFLEGNKVMGDPNTVGSDEIAFTIVASETDNYKAATYSYRGDNAFKGYIKTFTVSPSNFSVMAGDVYTRTLTLTVDPSDIDYTIELVTNWDWVSLVGNTIYFRPPETLQGGTYRSVIRASSLNSLDAEIICAVNSVPA